MSNIAYYQEGYTDGYNDGYNDGREMKRNDLIRGLYQFIREQKDEETDTLYLRGYNMALRDLKEYIENII